eukprot:150509_1
MRNSNEDTFHNQYITFEKKHEGDQCMRQCKPEVIKWIQKELPKKFLNSIQNKSTKSIEIWIKISSFFGLTVSNKEDKNNSKEYLITFDETKVAVHSTPPKKIFKWEHIYFLYLIQNQQIVQLIQQYKGTLMNNITLSYPYQLYEKLQNDSTNTEISVKDINMDMDDKKSENVTFSETPHSNISELPNICEDMEMNDKITDEIMNDMNMNDMDMNDKINDEISMNDTDITYTKKK